MERGDASKPSTAESCEEKTKAGAKERIVNHKVMVLLPETALSEKSIEKIAKDFCRDSNTLLLARFLPAADGLTEVPHYKLLDDVHGNERFVHEMRKLFEKNSFSNLRGLPVIMGDPKKELEALVKSHGIQYIICFEERSDLLKKTGLKVKTYKLV